VLAQARTPAAADALRRLDAALAAFTWPASQKIAAAETVNNAKQALLDAARHAPVK
jgi:hypothetical protein